MGFVVKYDFILDMLCAFDVLTGEQGHEEIYERFGKKMSKKGLESLAFLTSAVEGNRLGPALVARLAATEDFHFKTLKECFGEDPIGCAVAAVGEELIEKGFHDYWLEEVRPLLADQVELVEGYIKDKSDIWDYQSTFTKQSGLSMTLWLCHYSKPHRFQLGTNQYVGDSSLVVDYLQAHEKAEYPSEYDCFGSFLKQIQWGCI